MPRHIVIKLTNTKLKVRIIKASREKQQVTYKGNPICLTADLSAEILQARREWQDIFKVLKGENLQPRLLYPARSTVNTDRKIKSFLDKQKLREFSTIKQTLKQMLKGLIQSRNTREEIQNQAQTIKKMAIGTYISIITLNVNGVILQPKDTDWLNRYKNKTHISAAYKKPT